jgi:hypothetical protein
MWIVPQHPELNTVSGSNYVEEAPLLPGAVRTETLVPAIGESAVSSRLTHVDRQARVLFTGPGRRA